MRRRRERRVFLLTFLGPPVLLYAGVVLLPAINAFRYSLTRWDGLSAPHWVGLRNYARLLAHGSDFIPAIENNAFLTAIPGVVILGLALYFAYAIHQRVTGARVFRIAFFFPNVISSVAIALLWILIYSATSVGLLNNLLRLWFHRPQPIAFTDEAHLYWSLVPMIVWTATGFYMILFLAGMENIPQTFYEAAKLDQAGPAQMFAHITLPLIWDVLTTGVIFLVVGGLKIFDVIWVMENGRPNTSTHVMATLMYSSVFQQYDIGYGTAIAVLLFIQVLLATLISFRLLRRDRLEYA